MRDPAGFGSRAAAYSMLMERDGALGTREEWRAVTAGMGPVGDGGAPKQLDEPSPAGGGLPAPNLGARGWAWIKLAIAFGLLGGGVAVLLGVENSPFVYSYRVDEVVAAPSGYLGRTLRVEGQLQNGSIRFREQPCEWRFVLEHEGRRMPVEFPQCVVPDTFRDGMGISVVVEGMLREDGSFVASQVIPRCPSRYEMEQRQRAGEAMPHPPPSGRSTLVAHPPPS